MIEILKELCETFGPSGFEEQVRNKIKRYLEDYKKGEIIEDNMGNLIFHLKGEKPSLSFSAHIDEVGVVCINADENGFLECAPLGGVYPNLYTGSRIIFKNGVIGVFMGEDWKKEVDSFSKVKIDIGEFNRDEALKKVPIGEPAVVYSDFVEQDGRLMARNLDNRAGVSVLLDAIREMKEVDRELFFIFNTQEELGLRGAKVFSEYLGIDYNFTIDVSSSGDTYSEPIRAFSLGKGAGIRVVDRRTVFPLSLVEYLEDIASKNNVKIQRDVGSLGLTDAFYIQMAQQGIKAIAITIPIRYAHSPSSFILLSDLIEVKKLILSIINFPPK